ncbi:M3 family oligoendopeptidase [Bradyrhizobium manausense]|uniref:M3 family oligoendopeptidase n=1 Tax=Bradyrhizobium TaxID=374 RepID=UPI001BAAAD11|nr:MULTISPECIES: M3 family oligoendopeptidase [Bradyrhizobium]MBR0825210.1 M3 family oligoendopeptidase [Bradyrhizobium manausense]UVO28398.1 M3 family oligoendopeptidase [Bradyrhizobium arachidis]
MSPRSTSALRKPNTKKTVAKAKSKSIAKSMAKSAGKPASKTGKLPEWNLADLYSGIDAPEVARDLEKMAADCVAFETDYKGKLATGSAGEDGGKWLAEAVRRYEAIDDLAGRLGSYAGLVHAGDSVSPAISKFYGDVSERLTEASTHLLFFALELNRIDDDLLARAMQAAELAHYRPWIEDLRKEKPYQLEDKLEQLFLEKAQTGYSAFNRLFDQTISSLRFKVGAKELAIEPTLNFLQDRDGAKRKSAAEALAKTFKANERTFALITNTLAKDKDISDRWRGFKDVADSRHLNNRVEREVVDALVASVRAAYPKLSHRYYGLKAKWFGKKRLAYWDRNAPLPFAATDTIAWPEARNMVLTAYRGFSPKMADIAERFFTDRWIDAPVRPGKAPGAFSHPTTPSAHPYVLMNYQGKPRDVMTLAHELGHGVHQVLAARNGALMAPTPLTLAETASVFGEMLTFKRLLAQTKNAKQRQALLAGKVEDMINTVVRQIAFYSFERAVHTERKNGELTAERIGEIWLSVQGESLGPAIEIKAGYESYWMYIPHFIHSPFYVYAYAFGDCLVNSLYAVYEHAAEGFAERYLDMLAAGGTKHYSELLRPFGLDAKDPKFWDGGLSVIAGMIDELEAMG